MESQPTPRDLQRSLEPALELVGGGVVDAGRDEPETHHGELGLHDLEPELARPVREVRARSTFRSISRAKPSDPRCFQESQSFSARNGRVPSSEYWYQWSGRSSGPQTA